MSIRILFLLTLTIILFLSQAATASFLHAPHDSGNGFDCITCHQYPFDESWPGLPAPVDRTADGTPRNLLCLNCHDGQGPGPTVNLHSSLGMAPIGRLPNWTVACVDCHNPHFQEQLQHHDPATGEPFLVTATTVSVSTSLEAGGETESTLIYDAATGRSTWLDPSRWSAKTDAGRGLLLVPDINEHPLTVLEVIAANAQSVTVRGRVPETAINRTFGLLYGQMIRPMILTTTARKNVFFPAPDSFVDTTGGNEPVGICQVCHSQTNHWRATPGAADSHQAGTDCTLCHQHTLGFAPRCAGCHAFPPDYPSGQPKANSHQAHRSFGCEACHQATAASGYQISGPTQHNDGVIALDPGPGIHFSYTFAPAGSTCANVSCHGGTDATWGGTLTSGCLFCHATPMNDGDSLPPGGRRAVAAEFPANDLHAHYGNELNPASCVVCHDQSSHGDGFVDLFDPDGGAGLRFVQAGDLTGDPDLSTFCSHCHDADGASRLTVPLDPFGNGNRPPDVASRFMGTLQWNEWYGDFCFGFEGSKRPTNSHHDISDADQAFSGAKIECTNCHGVHTASRSQPLADPFDTTSPFTGAINDFCLACHNGGANPASPGFPNGVSGPVSPREHEPRTACDSTGDGVADPGYVFDCADRCVVEQDAADIIGDTSCDDGYSGFDLRCAAFSNDGDDCGTFVLETGYSLLQGLDTCTGYVQNPWFNDVRWSNDAHGPGSKRGWSGYSGAPAHAMDCVACHDPHGSYDPITNPAGNPYMFRDAVDGTSFIDDGVRPTGQWNGPPWTTPGTSGPVVITSPTDGMQIGDQFCAKCHAKWLDAYDWHGYCTACQTCHSHGAAFGGNDFGPAPNDTQWCPTP